MESLNAKKKPLVSIIMAAYNGEKIIRQSIDSILEQTYENFELIIIDDGSSDKTAEVVKTIHDKRIHYFRTSNSGAPAKPRNFGINQAKGEFIALCDQDDLWAENKLEEQLGAYYESEDTEKIGLVFSSANIINEDGKKIGENLVAFDSFTRAGDAFHSLLGGNYITACSIIIPKKVIDRVGKFDESLKGVDDYDLWLRIGQQYGILALMKNVCSWRVGKESLSANKAKLYLENEKIFDKLEEGNKNERVHIGHGRNLGRIFVAALADNDKELALKVRKKIKLFKVSLKMSILLKIFDLSLFSARALTLVSLKLGIMSL